MSQPAIQILYGHFDVLLFTYGFPFTDAPSTARLASNKDSSFLWKDALRTVPDQNSIFKKEGPQEVSNLTFEPQNHLSECTRNSSS